MLISPAYAQAAGAAGAGGDVFAQFVPLLLIFVVFYFLLIRPQQKKVKLQKSMLGAIRRGDRVVTGGGIFATVTKIKSDTEVQVEIADGVRVLVARETIATVISKTDPADNTAPTAPTANDDNSSHGGSDGDKGKSGGLKKLLGR